MNTDKKVFNRLFSEEKTELGSQAYEFALADDIKAASKALAEIETKIKPAKSKAMEAIGNYNQFANGGIARANALVRLVDELIKKSNELGVTPPSDLVAMKQDAVAKAKLFTSNVSSAASASKTILQ
jgi:DNA-binding SARP family transcriptional activator